VPSPLPTSLLLSALTAAVLTGCAASARSAAPASPSAAVCTGARYHFGRPATARTLLSVSSAHALAAGQPMTDDERRVRFVHATAVSTAGEADAATAYRAYAVRAAAAGTWLGGYNQYLPVRPAGTMTPTVAGRYLLASVASVDTVTFTRSCIHGSPATGTVTAWHADPDGNVLRCGYTHGLTPPLLEAEHLACGEDDV
jgi:hypothetical protein